MYIKQINKERKPSQEISFLDSFELNKIGLLIFYFRLFSGVDFEQTNEYLEKLCLCHKEFKST